MLKSLHPVLRLFTAQPQLALDHAGFYFDWLDSEVTRISAQWRWRLILFAVAIASVGAALVLAGVAVMLIVIPMELSPSAGWVLVVTPLFPLLLALACAAAMKPKPQEGIVDQLKEQIREDILMFRESSAH
jgi:hypothetical protein